MASYADVSSNSTVAFNKTSDKVLVKLQGDEDPEQVPKCDVCREPASKTLKTLGCISCKKVYHYECGAFSNQKVQEILEKKGWICAKCLKSFLDLKRKEGQSTLKKVGKHLALSAGLTAICLGGIPLLVGALGFGAAGVTAGSLAAAYQSAFLGGNIAAGSAFSILQSVGAAGLAASTKAAIAGVCTALPLLKRKKS